MKKKIYFAGSIRGGRDDASLYERIIDYIKQTDIVLTEHIGNLNLSPLEQGDDKDTLIYIQDTSWIRECDILIAECTFPSLGVGYELSFAENLNKPCHILFNKDKTKLSAMLNGNQNFNIYPYSSDEEIYQILDRILK